MSLFSLWWESREERVREAERGYIVVKNDPKAWKTVLSPWGLRCLSHCSVAKLCPTLCDPMDCSTPGSPVLHYLLSLLKFMSIESMMLSNHLILWCPLLCLPSTFPSTRVFSKESALHIRRPKWRSFSISPSNECSGLISIRIDWFDLPAVQGTLKVLLQHHSLEASILRRSASFMVQLSHPYMTTAYPMHGI